VPPVFGSYHAAVAQQYELGVDFGRQGLIANPGLVLLRNNLAFCLAKLGEVAAAAKELEQVDLSALAPDDQATLLATHGLIAFRSGDPVAGKEAYERAIRLARDARVRAIALIMLAVEEATVRHDEAEATASLALETARKSLGAADHHWTDHLNELTGRAAGPHHLRPDRALPSGRGRARPFRRT
jgi:tetratricopeptide (TPR) repeat protein